MAVDDKYVMNGVWLTCDKGVTPSRFNVTPKPVQLYDEHFANELDKIALVNILPFGACSVKYGSPCVPMPLVWNNVMDEGLTVLGARPLLDTSKCQCGIGGQISIHFTKAGASAAAQSNQLDHADEAADKLETASTWAFWGGVGLAVGGAILCATGVGAPLGAAMIVGAEVAIEASTVMASASAVIKGVTKFARNPTLENGLSIVGETAVNLVEQYVLNKLGGAAVRKLGNWGTKVSQKLNLSERAKSIAHRIRCFFTGHPVDVISGYLYTEAVDFEFPGPLPLRWERLWYSTSIHAGALGHGWHHSYDLALVVEEAEGFAGLRGADGRGIAFDVPALGERAFNRLEKMSLLRDERGYGVLDHEQGLTYRFGPAGPDDVRKLVAVENANGFAITLAYDGRGYLVQIIDSAKRQFAVQCDEAGRILTISTAHPTEPRQRVTLVTYNYNGRGELISVADALYQTATYQYQEKLLVQETFKNGLSFYFEYMGQGPEARCTRTWGDEGIYDHKLVYDLDARRTVVTNSLGYATTYLGNENGLVEQVQDARGGVTSTEYNEFNEVLSETDPLGLTTRYKYNERGNCLLKAMPDGARMQYEYDQAGHLLALTDAVGGGWQWTYSDAGLLICRSDPRGQTMSYTYQEGRLMALTDVATHRATTLRYDAGGNLLEFQTADGQKSRWLYDGWGRVHKSADARGNVQWREHDLLSRVLTVHEPDGNVRRFAYDGLDNVTRAQDRHAQVQYTYRGLGRLIRRVEAGTAVEFLHDTEEQLRAVVNEHGLAYRFELDGVGDVVTEAGFDGLTRRYQRDAGGRVVALELPTGQRTHYRYDPAGRVTQVQYGDGSTETYAYRADGALVMAHNEAATVVFQRDMLGQVLQEAQNEYTVTNTYNVQGQRVGLTSSLGAAVRYAHNDAGQLVQVQAGSWQALFERDAQGLEIQRTLSGGVATGWQRDQLGRPAEQFIRTRPGRGAARTRTYGWQAGGRLTQLADSQHGLTQYEHDAVGNLAATIFGDGTRELRLSDAVGNLFGRANCQDRRYGPAGQLLEARGTRYVYDALGNLSHKTTARGQQWHYAWHASGHLAEVVCPDGGVVSFTYDALGRRVSKRYQGRVTRWVWEGNNILHEWSEGGIGSEQDLTTWLFEEDSFAPAAKLTAQGNYSVIADHLGTPLALYDRQGQATWEMTLDSYGAVRQGKGQAQDCPFRYQGQYEDVETGLYYNRFRYYDPEMGQYISQDPIRLLSSSPLYNYVNDPTISIDVFGLSCSSDAKKLRANMIAAGEIEPAYENAAHHIVMSNTTDTRMIKLRQQLKTHNIDINDADNGIFLARSTAIRDANGLSSIPHSAIHSDTYKQAVFDKISPLTSASDIRSALDGIRSDIASGIFSYKK